MGSHDFDDEAFGATAEQAFHVATERAQWERGHEPYNGTISTVGNFVEVEKPRALTDIEWEELVWWIRDEVPQPDARPHGIRYVYSTGQMHQSGRALPPPAVLPELKVRRKFDHEWQRTSYQRRRALLTKCKRLSEDDLRQLALAARSIEKWELCVCYRASTAAEKEYRERHNLKGKHGHLYRFFGLAAC
jgi:hypothetical protein